MTFTVTVKLPPLEVAFEAGSISEAAAILADNGTALATLFATEIGAPAATGETPAKRGRGPAKNKNQPDPAAAQAPAPLAPPAAAPPAAAPPAPESLEIPAALRRDPPSPAAPPPPAPAPAPMAPPPPPPPLAAAPPIAPPTTPLCDKVIADLRNRAKGSADGGKSLADWLITTGAVVAGANFEEALAVLQFVTPEKIAAVAKALGVTV